MADENEPLPRDYFLTDYERDLLRLPIEDAMRKYPLVPFAQLYNDWVDLITALPVDDEH